MRPSVLRRSGLVPWVVALSPAVLAATPASPASPANPSTPSTPAQAQLAAQDAEIAAQMVAWNEAFFQIDETTLPPDLRAPVAGLVRTHSERLRRLMPAWIAEERAATAPGLKSDDLRHALVVRSINEMALQTVESLGATQDEAWSRAASSPKACQHQNGTFFRRRIAVIQAAPADLQPTLLAAEGELLAHWGTRRQDLPPRPERADLLAADFAIARLRAGLPVSALPMTPVLAAQVFDRDRKPGRSDVWEQCARSQWWLQSQRVDDKADRKQALTVYRYATLQNIDDFISRQQQPKATAGGPPEDPAAFPLAASVFRLRGATTLRVSIDDAGKPTRIEILERRVRAPGLRDTRPVAFEAVFDDASLAQANQRSYPAGKAMGARFVAEWRFEGKTVDDQ